ncbi:MAG: peptide chain release factor 2 [Syntrophomonadaceae bacterium]|nr:peptide chain release factor 2 [Syntrophomonadaceae bacterium]
MIEDPKATCSEIFKKLAEMRESLDIDKKTDALEQLQIKASAVDFWDNNIEAQSVLKEISSLETSINKFNDLWNRVDYIQDFIELAEKEHEEEFISEIDADLQKLVRDYREFELLVLFSDEHDKLNAIISLHAGAGGTEAQDWVEMLLRMYTRWAETSGYQTEILDLLAGDEAGIKSVTFLVNGLYAYGKLKCEEGVHRLVRISPFDASGRRHTSFASLSALPEIDEDLEIVINSEDLQIDTYRSSGAGGQHVNKTDSAVRITHLPTGLVVQCQNQRSQHANRLAAMKILQAKLFTLKQKANEDMLQKFKGEYKEIAWGSQIRSYTMNPFSLVKDHRTNMEIGQIQAVMDGEIDDLIYGVLQQKNTRKS